MNDAIIVALISAGATIGAQWLITRQQHRIEEANLNNRLTNIDNKLISHDSYGNKIDNIVTDVNSIKVDMAVVKNDVTWMKNRTTPEVRTNVRRRQQR